EYPPTPAPRSTTPTTKTRGCYVGAAQTGNGRCPNQQCTRHHRSDRETNTASKVVAARTGNGRMPAEPQTPPRNHQQQETPTFLPLPARQSAFLAYFLFGQKKVGRSGGAKAFDFDFEVKAFEVKALEVKAFDFRPLKPLPPTPPIKSTFPPNKQKTGQRGTPVAGFFISTAPTYLL
ncbi:hypothetical protein, partial [Cupriavidus basilensis]|uniref:hypothetical protein n=1 Tax=Cupriavidus basilensis TaxID=68895 RepID=UPI001E5605E0